MLDAFPLARQSVCLSVHHRPRPPLEEQVAVGPRDEETWLGTWSGHQGHDKKNCFTAGTLCLMLSHWPASQSVCQSIIDPGRRWRGRWQSGLEMKRRELEVATSKRHFVSQLARDIEMLWISIGFSASTWWFQSLFRHFLHTIPDTLQVSALINKNFRILRMVAPFEWFVFALNISFKLAGSTLIALLIYAANQHY